jgi:DNA-binding FrmR family transcriptional regulator
LAQQLHAVESAVINAKRELIHDHIEHCLDGTEADTKTAMRELKQLT